MGFVVFGQTPLKSFGASLLGLNYVVTKIFQHLCLSKYNISILFLFLMMTREFSKTFESGIKCNGKILQYLNPDIYSLMKETSKG